MNSETLNKLRKYIFLLSLFFFIGTGFHLVSNYLYLDAKETPVSGGSFSEGFIGDFPTLNPFLPSKGQDKYIVDMLYRSLLRYDTNTGKFVSDLAKCNVSSFASIDCYLQDNLKWSNGENITTQDVVSTFNVLKSSGLNPVLSSITNNLKITEKDGIIEFRSDKKDINIYSILIQPIVSKKYLDNINEENLYGSFNPLDGLYSGYYKIDTISFDDALGIKKLILMRNEYYTDKPYYIEKIVLKFFKDVSHFLKHKDTVNAFYDSEKILVNNTTPRFNVYEYYQPQYISLFVNSINISSVEFRKFILSKISRDNIMDKLSENNKPVINPYMGEESIDSTVSELNLALYMKEMGYYKKSELISILSGEQKDLEKEVSLPDNIELEYLLAPIKNKYNFISEDDILLTGTVLDETPSAIYINDYKLKSYSGGDKFYYRLRKDYDTIKEGTNSYKIYFEIDGEKKLKEELFIIYYEDPVKLEEEKKKFLDSISSISKDKLEQERDENKGNIEKIGELDEAYFYDKTLNPFEIILYYMDTSPEMQIIVDEIKKSFAPYGFNIVTEPINKDILSSIANGNKNYDMLLAGISLGYFDDNIFPYFHSGQSGEGYNFSNIKNPTLDVALENIKENNLSNEAVEEAKKQVLDILKEEQVVKTFFSPPFYYLVDKNIKNFTYTEDISSINSRYDAFSNAYITYKSNINSNSKSMSGFFNYIFDILF